MAKQSSKKIADGIRLAPPLTSRWRSKGAAILVAVGLWLAIVLAYAGSMAAMAVYRLIVDGGVLVLWLAASIGIGLPLLKLFRASDASTPSPMLAGVTASALGLGTMSLVALLLGLVGLLNLATAIALVVIGVGALLAHLITHQDRSIAFRQWRAEPAGIRWLALLAVPVAAMMTVGALLPPYTLWTPQEPHGYDVVEYHLQVPREWYEAGRIFPLHHNVFSFLPFNVEMHYLLAMHLKGGPWAGMYLAQFMHGAFVILSVIALGAVIMRLTGKPGGMLVGVLAAAGAPMLPQLGAIAYVEGGFLLFGTLSIGWTLIGLREPENRIRRFVLAGVMAGLACGAKLTALPEILVAVPVVVMGMYVVRRQWRSTTISSAVAMLAAFGVGAIVAFGPWLLRTHRWAGNPLFPEVSQLGRGPFTPGQQERWRRSLEPTPDQQSIAGRLKAGWLQIAGNWQYGFLLVPGAIVAFAINRRNFNIQFLGAMLFLMCVFWLGFTHLQARFFVLAVPICAMLMATAPRLMLPVVVVQAIVAAILLHVNLAMNPKLPWSQEVELLGIARADWFTSSVTQQIPEDASISLIGDAKAFLYQMPMSKLKYRTVFDVDATNGQTLIDAYAGPATPGEWLVIDPDELQRFERTYHPFPSVPPEIKARHEPFAVQR